MQPREVSKMVWWTGAEGSEVSKWVVGPSVRPCSTGGGVARVCGWGDRLCALRSPWAKCAIRSTLTASFKKVFN